MGAAFTEGATMDMCESVAAEYLDLALELYPDLGGKILYKAYKNNVKDLFRTGGIWDMSLNVRSTGEATSLLQASEASLLSHLLSCHFQGRREQYGMDSLQADCHSRGRTDIPWQQGDWSMLDKADFIGTGTLDDGYDTQVTIIEISEKPDAAWIPAGVSEDKLIGLQIEGGIWFAEDLMKVWINTLDYTLIVPDQVICKDFTFGAYGTYDGEIEDGEGEIDTMNKTITFYLYSVWGPYSLGDGTLTISDIHYEIRKNN